jgi:hypothetical protein
MAKTLNYACKSCGKLIKESGRCEKCANNRTELIHIILLIIGLILFVTVIYSIVFNFATVEPSEFIRGNPSSLERWFIGLLICFAVILLSYVFITGVNTGGYYD